MPHYFKFTMRSPCDGSRQPEAKPRVILSHDGHAQVEGAGKLQSLGNGDFRYEFTSDEWKVGALMALAQDTGSTSCLMASYMFWPMELAQPDSENGKPI